jgi:hypothetical protein
MAFTIRLCPYCGGEISADDPGYYSCQECGKRTFRSRSNSKAFLLNKSYEAIYSDIINGVADRPENSLEKIQTIMDEAEEINADMLFTRGVVYSALGEDGKAHNDWRKGLEMIQDLRFIDAYIIAVCKSIMETICMKEREFMDFNPIEYIDQISAEFSQKADIPCKGIFYITVYRNLRMYMQSGGLSDDEDIYFSIVPKLLKRMLAYGRNYRTVCSIIEEVLEDFHYKEETYVEDDNLRLHLCDLLKKEYETLGANFSEEHQIRIFRHWNDQNMFELEYWVGELMKSVNDNAILMALRKLSSNNDENFDLEAAVEDYVRKFLLLSKDGKDLSPDS